MGDGDYIGKTVKGVKKFFSVVATPYEKYSQEKEKHRRFEETRLEPINREINSWGAIYKGLENIVTAGREDKRQDLLKGIESELKVVTDSYRKDMSTMVKEYRKTGLGGTHDLRVELQEYFDGIESVVKGKLAQKEEIMHDEGPKKLPLYGWGAAKWGLTSAGVYLAYRVFVKK